MENIATWLLVVSLLVTGLLLADIRSRSMQRVADCVVSEAKAQGYAGNPYSREAWDLFAPSCK